MADGASERGRDEMPVAGRNYPRTWAEFAARFPDDAACMAYLEELRWPGGFICPSCDANRGGRHEAG